VAFFLREGSMRLHSFLLRASAILFVAALFMQIGLPIVHAQHHACDGAACAPDTGSESKDSSERDPQACHLCQKLSETRSLLVSGPDKGLGLAFPRSFLISANPGFGLLRLVAVPYAVRAPPPPSR
jgi:hypothetical protein